VGKSAEPAKVPWSGFDLINAFNAWKRSEAAGGDESGAGLVWRSEVCQQVFEEAAVDLGRALEGFSAVRKRERQGKPPRFPKFKRKATARQSFRHRNKGSGTAAAIRIGEQEQARVVRLPKLGNVRVRESTRRLRRMLRKGRAKILFATVSTREGGHWRVSLNVEASPLHSERRPRRAEASPVGIDRGLSTFAAGSIPARGVAPDAKWLAKRSAWASESFVAAVAVTRPTATPMLQRAWRSIRGCPHPRHRRLVEGLASPPSRRRRETSVERTALAHAPCGVCVKPSSMKQKGPRSNAREGRCCTKLSTRCRQAAARIGPATPLDPPRSPSKLKFIVARGPGPRVTPRGGRSHHLAGANLFSDEFAAGTPAFPRTRRRTS